MNFIVFEEETYGRMAVNIDNIVNVIPPNEDNGYTTRIDTVIHGYPLYTKQDISKELFPVIRSRNGVCLIVK